MFLTVLEFLLLQHFVLEALKWLHTGEILTTGLVAVKSTSIYKFQQNMHTVKTHLE